MELDAETLEALGVGEPWEATAAHLYDARRRELVSRRAAERIYQETESYRAAHRAAALRYYYRNRGNPRVRVRGASVSRSRGAASGKPPH